MKLLFRTLVPILLILLVNSCKKPGNDPGPGNTSGGLTPISVSVEERIPDRAIISWTASVNTISTETVKYRVYLGGQVVHSGLFQTRDTLLNLVAASAYTGKVVAYTSTDSTMADFVLDKIDGGLIIGRYDGGVNSEVVECYDIYNGTRLWRTVTGTYNTNPYGSPTVSNDTVFITHSNSNNFSVFALNAKTGVLLWKAVNSGGTNTISDASYYNGKLYVVLNGKLICMDARNGQQQWTYQAAQPFFGAPAVRNGRVYAGGYYNGGGSILYALNADNGNIAWQYNYAGVFQGHAIVNNGSLIFVTGAAVYSLKESDGSLNWKRVSDATFQSAQSPVIYNNQLIITGGTANLGYFGIDKLNGNTVWNFASGGASFAPAVDGNNLYFSDYYYGGPNHFKAINAATGAQLWDYNNINIRYPVAVNNRLYAFVQGRTRVVVYDCSTGYGITEMGYPYLFDETGFVVIINDKPYYPSSHPNYN